MAGMYVDTLAESWRFVAQIWTSNDMGKPGITEEGRNRTKEEESWHQARSQDFVQEGANLAPLAPPPWLRPCLANAIPRNFYASVWAKFINLFFPT